jgi:4-alpha-glucanotransferase
MGPYYAGENMGDRGSGVLLHITSLPSPFGIGDLGPSAYAFADWLAESKQRYWQILPLTPTGLAYGNSPYHSTSAFAGNPLLLSPEILVQEGFLSEKDLEVLPLFPDESVDFGTVVNHKDRLFQTVYGRFKDSEKPPEYWAFCAENAFWLDDFSVFAAAKSLHPDQTWNEWPEDLRNRDRDALSRSRTAYQDRVEKERFLQYLFFKQWSSLKRYCNQKGISIIGDMPIYVVYDSADLWAHANLFHLNLEKRPITVAGVPPDYFSETGQLWGNPVYRWDALEETDYEWWIQRVGFNLQQFDLVRVDHFRGFLSYWEVPAREEVATNGRWVKAPAVGFFNRLRQSFPNLPIIAEDLGAITPDVWDLMDRFGFPGMKVLLFAFGRDLATNPHAPHNHTKNCVVYTGTHDNNTARGWFEHEAALEDRQRLSRYLGREVRAETVHWELIRLAMMSVADRVIFPVQDVLGLGEGARMNRPAKKQGNWGWRVLSSQLTPELSRKLSEMTDVFGRGDQGTAASAR